MKTFSKILAAVVLSAGMVTGLASFKPYETNTPASELRMGNIEFKIENNSGSEFKYCVNGGHNSINKGATKSFSYGEGQEFKYIDGSNCGSTWFKVTSSMSGKTFKLSELTK